MSKVNWTGDLLDSSWIQGRYSHLNHIRITREHFHSSRIRECHTFVKQLAIKISTNPFQRIQFLKFNVCIRCTDGLILSNNHPKMSHLHTKMRKCQILRPQLFERWVVSFFARNLRAARGGIVQVLVRKRQLVRRRARGWGWVTQKVRSRTVIQSSTNT